MPELPEVETVRRQLDSALIGRRIAAVVVGRQRTIRRYPSAKAFVDAVPRSPITGTGRRGKYFWLAFDDGRYLVMHLRMSGSVRVVVAECELEAHSHVRLTLDNGDEIRFIDPRTFGEIWVVDGDGLTVLMDSLGFDALEPGIDGSQFARATRSKKRQIKALLLDQHFIAGIGNIYADECLWRARIHPLRASNTLSVGTAERLFAAIQTVMKAAVAAGGSTLRDARYVDTQGKAGWFQVEHEVYGRDGQPCRRCGTRITRLVAAGRSSYVCPRCQRA